MKPAYENGVRICKLECLTDLTLLSRPDVIGIAYNYKLLEKHEPTKFKAVFHSKLVDSKGKNHMIFIRPTSDPEIIHVYQISYSNLEKRKDNLTVNGELNVREEDVSITTAGPKILKKQALGLLRDAGLVN